MVVEFGPLPDGHLGEWDIATRTVWIRPGLTQVQRRCVLAHELEHARTGDRPIEDPVLDARRERQVEEAAARRLITIDALIDGLQWCRDERELAAHLWVDRTAIRARLDGLTTEEHDYIDGRLGAAKEDVA